MYKGPYHILTPFSRFQNLVAFSKHLRSFKEVPLIWHPILDDDLPFTLDGAVVVNDFRIEEWIIRPVRTLAKVEGWYPVYTKQNHFADHYPLNEEELRHRFVLLNDDDFVRRDFFEKLDAVDGNVLITSMERGTPVMPKYQPFLKASPENVQYGSVGNEQLVVTGEVLKDPRWRFSPHYSGDWDYIEKVVAVHKPVFVPEAVVLFNWLEDGRWER